eukprot:scaffold703_cov245-Pinguiococcus_pyrenoidosus.AAC.7
MSAASPAPRSAPLRHSSCAASLQSSTAPSLATLAVRSSLLGSRIPRASWSSARSAFPSPCSPAAKRHMSILACTLLVALPSSSLGQAFREDAAAALVVR